jgi:hypothetical protein
LNRQDERDELTRRIQDKRAKAAKRQKSGKVTVAV